MDTAASSKVCIYSEANIKKNLEATVKIIKAWPDWKVKSMGEDGHDFIKTMSREKSSIHNK